MPVDLKRADLSTEGQIVGGAGFFGCAHFELCLYGLEVVKCTAANMVASGSGVINLCLCGQASFNAHARGFCHGSPWQLS